MKYLVFLTMVLTTTAALAQQREDEARLWEEMQRWMDEQWEGDMPAEQGQLHGMVDLTWDSKYIWRGFDVYDDKSATHLLADLSLFDTGFGANVVGHRANSSGFEDRERWDFMGYYRNALFPGEPHATNFRVGWVYYNYPELNRGESIDLQEGQLIVAWPHLLAVEGLQPSYALIKLWPARSESRLPDAASGWLHILMLDYVVSVRRLVPEWPDYTIRLHSEVVYNDGVTPLPEHPNPDHDWSNAVFGASMDVALSPDRSVVFTPAVYYQITLEETVNEDEDELWASLSLRYTF